MKVSQLVGELLDRHHLLEVYHFLEVYHLVELQDLQWLVMKASQFEMANHWAELEEL
jgi:hypothetical protein